MNNSPPAEAMYLARAIEMVGGQTKMGRILGRNQTTVRTWLVRDQKIPPDVALDIEEACNFKITREQLCPLFRDQRILDDSRIKAIRDQHKEPVVA
jgi:DNA-binding transcriptional regulator YdaS (Cro superfamily)